MNQTAGKGRLGGFHWGYWIAILWVAIFAVWGVFGFGGVFSGAFAEHPVLKLMIYGLATAHLTIACMSLSFHRYHTHRGVVLNRRLDAVMQTWLWVVTSMSKLDWASVHIYHHANSDQERDPHSPVKKGIWHVLFLGAYDYTLARQNSEVQKIRAKLPTTQFEKWIDTNLMLGPIFLTALNLALFGWIWGPAVSMLNFALSPIFAVGGVNAIAHWVGYRNYETRDNSRNIGLILFPLNFIVCGELDHNNHHARPTSASFRHRWFEFDIGYVYLKVLSAFGLADIKKVAHMPVSSLQ